MLSPDTYNLASHQNYHENWYMVAMGYWVYDVSFSVASGALSVQMWTIDEGKLLFDFITGKTTQFID